MRNAWIVYVILLVGIGVAGWTGYTRVHESAEVAQRALDSEKLKRDYLERVGWVRANPDEHAYQLDLKPFFRDYFGRVDELVQKYHLNPKQDDYLTELNKRAKEEKTVVDPGAAEAVYQKVAVTYGALRQGSYAPFQTASSNGLRLDLAPPELKRVGAADKIVLPVVLWGSPRELHEDKASRTQRVVAGVGFDAVWKLFDASGKLIGEIHAGDPSMRVDYPERYIPFFPPQMVLGEYQLDKVPAEAAKIQMTVDANTHAPFVSSGKGTFSWSFPVPPEWKLAPGQAWQGAEISERPEEEINPPAAAGKKK